MYQSQIGSLMYLMLGTRPDITYTVGHLAHFAHDPSKKHFQHLGHIFGYVNATTNFAIIYKKSGKLPIGTCDADLGGELATGHRRKSTSGGLFLLAGGLISWSSKLQKTIAVSTMEAEYISLFSTGKQAAWIRNTLEAVGIQLQAPLCIWCDNQAAIAVANREGTHKAKKHIDIKYHYVQQLVEKNLIEVAYIPTKNNPADILTKCLTGRVFGHTLTNSNLTGVTDIVESLDSQPSSASDTPQTDSPNPDISASVYVDACD